MSANPASCDLLVLGDLVADLMLPIASLPLRADQHGWADGLFLELGGACTTIVAARRLALDTLALSVIGGDQYGEEILSRLAAEGVEVAHVEVLRDRQTVLCVVITDRSGRHVFLGIKDDGPPVSPPERWQEIVPRARALFTNGYTFRELMEPAGLLALLDIARAARRPVYFDPGPSVGVLAPALLDEILARTDVLLLTLEEAQHLAPESTPATAAAALHRRGPPVVVVKQGAEGCFLSERGDGAQIPALKVEVVDTVGAGDAFAAALIAGRLRGGSWQEAAALANGMGAAATTVQGAGGRLPPLSWLTDRLVPGPLAPLLPPP